ncbi:protein-glutamate O-methyltransferase CheR [Chloroflexia bacterium SDU3-3]|nr:protein-glutamate O-methyltransferase CheR [Chloroflexia bacterium SDU3-3]
MHFYAETLGLSDSAFSILRDLIHERTGNYYDEAKRDLLASKLSGLVLERGFTSFLEYYYLLRYDPAGEQEWPRLLDALSVPETFFWREPAALEALAQHLVPAWAAQHSGPLRIWSAGCATGEEPISIAIALREAGWLGRIPIQILATDASARALDVARRGIYRERSFRSMPPQFRERYFTPAEDGWQPMPEIAQHIQWSLVNLVAEEQVARCAPAPIIFCRNVFLYFSPQAIRATVERFSEHMPQPAYLFLGVAESILRLTTRFQLQEIGGAFVYVKQ